MHNEPALTPPDRARAITALRASVASVSATAAPVLPFGIDELDGKLAGGGIEGAGLHEITDKEKKENYL